MFILAFGSPDMPAAEQASNPAAFGVIYALNSVDIPSLSTAQAVLSSPNVKYVRLQWLDYTNTLRFRLVPIAYFKKLLASERPGTGVATAALGIVIVSLAPGFSSSGEYLLVPDLLSLRICPYALGHVSVMCNMQEKVPNPEHGLVVPLCPRTILRRVLE